MGKRGGANLVLGTIENYTFDQLRPFVLSLRNTGYAGDIVFFHQRVDKPTLRELRRHGVRTVPFYNLRGAWPKGSWRDRLDHASMCYYRDRWPFFGLGWKLLLPLGAYRYLLYRRYLARHGGKYRQALLTDVRDVIFQADPFVPEPAEDLLFYEESHTLDHGNPELGPFNANWITARFGPLTYERLAEKMTICSGTTIGTPAALGDYLDRVCQLLKTSRGQDAAWGDQALHNVVVYEGLEDSRYSIRICRNGSAQVYTLTRYLKRDDIPRGPDGEVVDSNGRLVPILHQYDRHPEIMATLLKRHAAPEDGVAATLARRLIESARRD